MTVIRRILVFCLFQIGIFLSELAIEVQGLKGGIIRRDGTQFVDSNGDPFLVHGCNFYWLMYQGADSSSRPFVTQVLNDAQKLGLNVGRTWAFSDGGYRALQLSPGVYDENVFQALDRALVEAKKRNIRLTLTLANHWDDFGGRSQYVKWAKDEGYHIGNDDGFYTHEIPRKWYKNHVKKILTRRNSVSGVRYLDDPTIFSWELMNELRCESDPSGHTAAKWVKEMAAYVKSIDKKHLLTVGMEGFYGAHHGASKGWVYPFNTDNSGTDFLRMHQIAHIDYATVHSYPDLWVPTWSYPAKLVFLRMWVNLHIRDATKILKMPVLFGEFGKKDQLHDYVPEQRLEFFWTVYNGVYASVGRGGGGVGSMLWQLFPKGMEDWNDGFAVYANDPGLASIIGSQSTRLQTAARDMMLAHNSTLGGEKIELPSTTQKLIDMQPLLPQTGTRDMPAYSLTLGGRKLRLPPTGIIKSGVQA